MRLCEEWCQFRALGVVAVFWLAVGCSDDDSAEMPEMPRRFTLTAVSCRGDAECDDDSLLCTEKGSGLCLQRGNSNVCSYIAKGVAPGANCPCAQGETDQCYIADGNPKRLGLRECVVTSDNASTWSSCQL